MGSCLPSDLCSPKALLLLFWLHETRIHENSFLRFLVQVTWATRLTIDRRATRWSARLRRGFLRRRFEAHPGIWDWLCGSAFSLSLDLLFILT